MPVYNASTYLAESIESILGQTYSDFELVISDDGSQDDSVAIVEEYAAQDSRIVHFSRKENAGVIYTRNEITNRVRGEWMATMDGDDISLPNRFEVQMAFIDDHPEYDFVGSAAMLMDPDGNLMCEISGLRSHEEIDAWHMAAHSGTAFVSPTSMIRTEALRAVGGYREHIGCAEDYDLFLRLAERGKLCTIPDVLLYYRQHFSSLGYESNLEQRAGIHRAVRDAYKRRGLPIPDSLFDETIPNRTESYAYRQWSEWSLRGGNVETARRYGWKAISLAPWSPRGWRALARAWSVRDAA
jgi:glycosyltransferase involved in cell wall biosynthesis